MLDWPAGSNLLDMVFIRPLLILVIPLFASGCEKRTEAPVTPRSDAAAAEANAAPGSQPSGTPDQPASATIVVPESGDVNVTLGQLSLELRKYVVRTRTAPKSFEEFLAKSHVQAPAAPIGKKYAVQSGSVVLVNR